jgi:hypothetical protein
VLADHKVRLAANLKALLDSRRDAFVIDTATLAVLADGRAMQLGTDTHIGGYIVGALSRTVSAASLRLVYDWATSDWPISLESYLSGMFHGREWDGTTPAFELIPEAHTRITADSLGLGHLYPPKP